MKRSRWLFTLAFVLGLVACQSGPPQQNQPPIASFTATPSQGSVPLTVAFDASASSDPDGSIVSYVWDFGDGGTDAGVTTSHTYETSGTFTARLTVSDNRGASNATTRTIVVSSTSSQTGTISGTVTPGLGGNAAATGTRLAPIAPGSWVHPAGAPFVPGELLVAFEPTVSSQAVGTLNVAGVEVQHVRALAVSTVHLYRAPVADDEALLALARQLSARPDVRYAHPNYILSSFLEPNDELYPDQWHYPAINLPQAWDMTTGSANTVVAVVDSGILFEAGNAARTHPDLVGKVLPGYDFISDPQVALDGDGRDPNPFDPGDNPGGQSSYHGSHVAGTIAAATNNGIGVAGVDWQAQLLPIRVLGLNGSGSLLDVLEGMIWAAGRSVPGVPNNPNPAHVINMSLGGQGSCFPAMQSFIDEALATGAIIVVAAGNENQNAANVSPASCSGVITVGATGPNGTRAPYSNYGSRIDVMAPGGDMSVIATGGVYSLMYDNANEEMSYDFLQGTSMAAPHVAGVIALMKAVKPDLTAQEALAALRATARPLSAGQCNRSSGSECGAGLIDVFAALQALQGGITPPPPGQVIFAPDPLDFGSTETEKSYTISNPGESTVTWTLLGFDEATDNPAPLPDGALYLPSGAPSSGTLAAGASATTALGIERDAITVAGFYRLELVFDISGQEQGLEVRFTIATPPSLSGPMIVAAFIENEAGELILSGFQESAGVISNYSFEVLAGANIVIAWSDENGNAVIDEGDYLGVYPEVVLVAAGQNVSGIDVQVDQIIGTTTLPLSEGARRQLERAFEGVTP